MTNATAKKPATKRAKPAPQPMSPEFFKVMDDMMATHRRNRRKAEKDLSKR